MAEIASNMHPIYTPAEDSTVIQIDDPIDAEHEVDEGRAVSDSTSEHTSSPQISAKADNQQKEAASVTTPRTLKAPTEVKKSVMSVKGTNGGPTTPTVKKIISSGTFGAGSVKPTGTKGTTPTSPSATGKVAAPPLRKTTTSPPTIAKPTLASSTSAKPSAPATTAARRTSVVPTKPATPPIRTSLSASARAKPAPEHGARSSVASPTASVGSAKAIPTARPRASVSDAVKKAPLSSRPSVPSSIKPPGAAKATPLSRSSAAAAPAIRPVRTASVSSIKEVKEDKALLELQSQLEEATKILEEKTEAVSDLEEQLANVTASLSAVSETSESQLSTIKETQEAKAALEAQLEETQKDLEKTQQQLEEVKASLQTVQTELEASKAAVEGHNVAVTELESRIEEIEAALASSKEQTIALEQAAAGASASDEAASIEREALLKAQADFKEISNEAQALKAAHAAALQESETQIKELRTRLAEAEVLESQLTALKAEKEENCNKLSELEIEILELKEAQDGLEDTRDSLQQRVSALEDELAKSAVAVRLAEEVSSNKDIEHSQTLKELSANHEKALETEAARYIEAIGSLEALKTQLSEALAAHEQSQKDLLDKEQRHASKLAALEDDAAATQATLQEEIAKITKELESQESIYNAKVDAVKAEHAQLLQEAFEKAKNEAADSHAQELQVFRASSNATIEEIKSANKIALDALKADHTVSLEGEIGDLQKQINKLNLELKATQDDLFKAKASLEAARFEVESLARQRDDALAQVNAIPESSPEQITHLRQLENELSNTRDDLKAVTEMLNLTKTSMTELSEHHTRELEEAAKGRADELLKLRAAHDSEVTSFANMKSDLLIRLSDLEGELASAKASLNAQQTSSPKSNSHGQSPLSSFVTKEELTKMHEAHNLKMNDLEAAHEKSMKLLKEELEAAQETIQQLNKDVAHRDMEIGYMRSDQEESEEQINMLKEDINTLTERLARQS